jgi:hypothetical protein
VAGEDLFGTFGRKEAAVDLGTDRVGKPGHGFEATPHVGERECATPHGTSRVMLTAALDRYLGATTTNDSNAHRMGALIDGVSAPTALLLAARTRLLSGRAVCIVG